jgi:tRNA G18 (ribose-2'-O)-methylase SpoU
MDDKVNKPKTRDGRNIIDSYFGWDNLAIKEDLDSKRFDYGVLCCNVVGDYNLSCIVRSANVFLAKEVIIYGKRHWDRRGAVGTQHYTNFRFVKPVVASQESGSLEQLSSVLADYDHVIAVDNIPGAKPLNEFTYPKGRILLVLGEERVGIQKEMLDRSHHTVYIKQFGSVRSLNVAAAASIVMYDVVSRAFS